MCGMVMKHLVLQAEQHGYIPHTNCICVEMGKAVLLQCKHLQPQHSGRKGLSDDRDEDPCVRTTQSPVQKSLSYVKRVGKTQAFSSKRPESLTVHSECWGPSQWRWTLWMQ